MAASRHTAAALLLVALLAACGTGSPTASNSGSPTSATSTATSAPFPANTAPDGGPARPGRTADPTGQLHVTALRLGEQTGYTRLVVDLSGAGVPQWRVAYSEPTGPGGAPVTIAGDAYLRLSLRTLAEPGVQTTSSVTGSGPIAEARTTGFFEGYEEVLVGVTGGRLPFRAFALTDPGRIVIDVRRP